MKLKVISINYESLNTEHRSRYAMDLKDRDEFLDYLHDIVGVNGAMILSTCNRVDIYFESKVLTALDVFKALHQFKNLGEVRDMMAAVTFCDNQVLSARHIVEVCVGLKSMVVGDKQIIGQFKDAYRHSLNKSMQGTILERTVQSAFRTFKRVRNETDFVTGAESLAYLAMKSIKSNVSPDSLLIVGAGEMARDVISYCKQSPWNKIGITNRTNAKSRKLAEDNGLEFIPFEVFRDVAPQYKSIVSCVSVKDMLIDESWELENKVIVDLGSPKTVSSDLATDNVIISIDELQEMAESSRREKQLSLLQVKNIVIDEINDFHHWWYNHLYRKFDVKIEERLVY